ncbi:MAG TPA: cobyrinate a,c-diamide synthase [Streptosporangiaceae bacterium]|nr:cobyrinate a,c-diamide synthase [Streptosporangiaceae bacterium]
MVAIPRLVIAAPASGCGKTTVACGLMAALRARGLAVSGHKVGPDYIDPGYHALATGRPPRNLDPFLCGEDLIAPLFLHGAAGADIAVVEGVMGLFDGVDVETLGWVPPEGGPGGMGGRVAPPYGGSPGGCPPGANTDYGSTAHVARLLAAPVVLVVDAARAGRSVAALACGFARFDPRTPVAGVILNRVASDRHERLLRDALAATQIPVFGAIRRTEDIVTPSRHLGLIPAAERDATARQAIAAMGDLIAAHCDLGALLALAQRAPALTSPAWDPGAAVAAAAPAVGAMTAGATASGPTIAVAAGDAFTFGYTEQAELLEAAGALVAPFDPLTDEDLPAGTDGLILGGGFPEVHAAGLSANERLRDRVAALAGRGAPVAAECAGLLYLARTLDGQPMCGVLDVRAEMTPKLTLGYRAAVAAKDSVLARAGDVVHGHEFHRTAADPPVGRQPAWRFTTGTLEGHVAGHVVASYLHTHWAGHPAAAASFTAACAKTPVPKTPAQKTPAR